MLKMLPKPISRFFEAASHYIILTIATSIIGVPVLVSWVTGTLDFLIQTIKSPTPLWASIAFVLVCCVYIYLKYEIYRPSGIPNKVKFFDVGGYRWKAIIRRDNYFELDKYPYCPVHDVRFVYSKDRKFCPGTETEICENNLPKRDEFIEYEAAKSMIDKKIRDKSY